MKKAIFALTFLLLLISKIAEAQITFKDTSSILHYPTLKSGAPIGVVDMNGDGLDDIITLDDTEHLYIQYQTSGGIFTGFDGGTIDGSQWSLCVADVDENGFNDIFTGGAYNGLKLLKANNSGSNYSMETIPGNIFLQGSNFVDIDNDNDLDIFACHDDGLSHPYRNDGEGNFTLDYNLIEAVSTFPSDNSGNYGSVWTDYDNDGDIDLYLSKCRLGVIQPTDGRRTNLLFQNDGDGNYTDVASAAGMLPLAQSWATDFADIDNDGDLDAFIINHDLQCQIRENQDNGTFVDITNSTGVIPNLQEAGFGLQVKFEDFDNDTYVDILFTSIGNSHVLFRNNGNKTFTALTGVLSPFNRIHSAATGDLNNDGFIDIYASYGFSYNGVSNSVADRLYFNEGNDNNYFKTILNGTISNINGVGARVELYGDWGRQIREVRSGESYGIMTSFTNHFGLGTATEIDSMVVRWPSGIVDKVVNPVINQTFSITEGTFCFNNADFDYNISEQFVNFTDFSNVNAGEWFWDFGNGFTSTERNPSHLYQSPGDYEVCLTIGGTCTSCQTVSIACNLPDASFGATATGLSVDFVDQSSADPTEWFWTFDDGPASSIEQNPSYTFPAPGTYLVCLIAANECGETTFCDFLTLSCDIPEATFEFEANELSLDFEDTSLPGANSWFWSFGDGNVSDEQNPSHAYELPGTYTVCLEHTNVCGNETTCQELEISCTPPNADFEYSIQSLVLNFTNQSGSDAENFLWDFGDGNSSEEISPSHEYLTDGNYEVCLTASSICGDSQVCQSIVIDCAGPNANFITNINELDVNFGDISTNDPTVWFWTFGDGNSSDEEFPQYSYEAPGNYQVCLVASNECGSDEICQSLEISCSAPEADFISSANELDIDFEDISTGNPENWLWTFGDNSTSMLQNPQHTYDTPGIYEVCLNVNSICGNTQHCEVLTVTCAAPQAMFSNNAEELFVTFEDNSFNNPTEWLWTFGDGNSSNLQNPSHLFEIPGIYEVCLNVNSICGSNQLCQNVLVSCSAPQSLFSYSNTDLNVVFNDMSTNDPGNWSWDFGDGNVSNVQNPSHIYAAPGTYEVCLEVSSICGTTTRCELVTVNCAAPIPSFSIIYNDLSVNFIDQSMNDPTAWLWDFGDGTGSTEQNPSHSYEEPGFYQVCLTTASSCGENVACIDIEVNCAAPQAEFSFEQNGLSISFEDESTNDPEDWLWDFGDGTLSINQNPIHTFQTMGLQIVCLTVSSICGADTLCQEFDLVVSTIDAIASSTRLTLYPNPAKDLLQFEILSETLLEGKIRIFDSRGQQCLMEQTYTSQESVQQIEIPNLAPGLYFFEFQHEKGRIGKRFIKL